MRLKLGRGMSVGAVALVLGVLAAGLGFGDSAWAKRISDIRNTKHNLSATSGNTIRASSETEVCVFCHTPHQTTTTIGPLWNRQASGATYSLYYSNSLDAAANGVASLDQPDGSSKLCLSCHDGTIAIGNVNVLRGKANQSITMSGGVTTMGSSSSAVGGGTDTGYTRVVGTDLSNDHPISFTYDATRASNDGELHPPTAPGATPTRTGTKNGVSVAVVGDRGPGAANKPLFPLENGKVQCASCHDPHIRDDTEDPVTKKTPTEGKIKFLRESRIQQSLPAQGQFTSGSDILCLGCHNKAGWAQSAHAVAGQGYVGAAATTREFAAGTKVWQASCLNCHDPHTVQGARRLLRDGTDGAINGQNVKSGGNSAIEQACYSCHSANGGNTVDNTGGSYPPDVQSQFIKTYRMPITGSPEVHDIGTTTGNATAPTTTRLDKNLDHLGANGIEGRDLLAGAGNGNRHAECPDCHNPHRVLKSSKFYVGGTATYGHHDHDTTSGTLMHNNVASGALRGAWGVEPDFGANLSVAFGTNPSNFFVKMGDPGVSADTSATNSFVTREYQICLKCHSNYAYGSSPPVSGPSIGVNNLAQYTNQAMEFAAPTNDQGEPSGTHRSWHPVMAATGRTAAVRNASASNWTKPWSNQVGSNTMYCSDCHGDATVSGTVVPTTGQAWGPHGSTNAFILKGPFTSSTGTSNGGDLCFKCHSYTLYATRGGGSSGFGGSKDSNLHSYHADKLGKMRCTWCHVGVPHGWKNKALLVNLNDVGPEVGLAAGTQVRNNTTTPYNNGPYYNNAVLKVKTFATSGNWSDTNCGSKGAPGNNQTGRNWMRDSNETCKSVGP